MESYLVDSVNEHVSISFSVKFKDMRDLTADQTQERLPFGFLFFCMDIRLSSKPLIIMYAENIYGICQSEDEASAHYVLP